MPLILANQSAVFDGSKIYIPRTGAWHAELVVDDQSLPDGQAVSGHVRIVIGDSALVLEGTVDVGGARYDTVRQRIVGGAGGLGKPADPRHYTDTTVRMVLTDLLATGGERLSDEASDAVLDRRLEHWTTIGLPIRRVIARLIASAAPDATWRVQLDGKIWVGVEEWPDSKLTTDNYQIIEESDDHRMAVIGMEVPTILPGTLLGGRKVSCVEYVVGTNLRIHAWFGDAQYDRGKAAIANVVRNALPDIEYRVPYAAKVDAQELGTVDVAPINNSLVPTMAKIPLMLGAPGLTSSGASGGVVLVCWAGGDPSQPRAIAFDPDAEGDTITWNIRTALHLGGSGTEKTYKAETTDQQLATLLDALSVYIAAIAAIADPTAVATPVLTTALNLFKAQGTLRQTTIVRVK